MKVSNPFARFSKEAKEPRELFLSLLLETDHVAGACWFLGKQGDPDLQHAVARKVHKDSWEDRLKASDEVITALEERTGSDSIHKVIFGLPAAYLTAEGDIRVDIRAHLKELTKVLALTPIGYVPLHQAIIYKLKKDEGMPPSVIVTGITSHDLTVAMYRVGKLVGISTHSLQKESLVPQIEEVLKAYKDDDVLPSRILMYGNSSEELELLKIQMLKHPWTSRLNFIHFPKIATLTSDTAITSVSLAGASEFAKSAGMFPDSEETEETGKTIGEEILQETQESQDESFSQEGEDDTAEDTPEIYTASSGEEHTHEDLPVTVSEDIDEKEEELANVRVVSPQSLGFQHSTASASSPVIAKNVPMEEEDDDENQEESEEESGPSFLDKIKQRFSSKERNRHVPFGIILIFLLICLIGGGYWFASWFLPQATVTVFVTQKQLSDKLVVSIDTKASTPDVAAKTIPGRLQEKRVSSDKSVPATGKKRVGDPAKGSLNLYNKAFGERSFKKGTVLTGAGIKFTLDSEIKIASATENLSQTTITLGKATAAVTAVSIGAEGNIPVGTEFTIENIPTSVASGRNDTAFSGGTSKNITVVSRADYDALVAAVSKDIVDKAKQDLLSASTSSSLKLIPETIKTSVAEKKFIEELDQEAAQVQGTVTVSVTGIAYDESDIVPFIQNNLKSQVPNGFAVDEEQSKAQVEKVQVAKDGKITATITLSSVAVPVVDTSSLQSIAVGKTVESTIAEIKAKPGIVDVVISPRLNIFKNQMPKRKENITVSISVQQ